MRVVAEDYRILIKPAKKGSCLVVWDRKDYLLEVKKLSDSKTYKEVKFGYNKHVQLVEESNRMFKSLFLKKCISPEKCRYFSYSFKKATNLGKLCFCLMMYQIDLFFLTVAHPHEKF